MKRKYFKLLRITGLVLIAASIMATKIMLIILICTEQTKHSIGIIGGADKPTFLLLVSQFKWVGILLTFEFVACVCCIIISSFFNKKK